LIDKIMAKPTSNMAFGYFCPPNIGGFLLFVGKAAFCASGCFNFIIHETD